MIRCLSLALAPLFLAFSSAQGYTLSRTYTGSDFINQFNFWNDAVTPDPTGNGQAPSAASYVPQAAAQQQGLVTVNSQGHFVLSVDSTFTYSGTAGRPSVRIASQQPIQFGVLILDAVHLPYGSGAWPAFWLSGADGNWPYSGEVDIYEGVGNSVQNTVSYHTSEGCSYDLSQPQTGAFNTAMGTDCNAFLNGDEACGSVDPSGTSYGAGASNEGGGVYAMEWTPNYIKVWHFDRNNIPGDITNGNPNPGGWGTPVTNLASTYCNINNHFGPQSIIFNIELCGTWEGNVFPGGPQACVSFVQQNPGAFKSAFFEIKSLKYYQ